MERRNDSEINKKLYENDYLKHQAFNTMNQMRKETLLCDVTLVANKVEMPAHKMILAAASPYFYAMFTSRFEESRQTKIILNEINSDILTLILEYIYVCKVELTDANVQDLLSVANFLQLFDVRDACVKFLQDQIDSTNCLGIRAFADLHDCQGLLNDANDYVLQHFIKVIECEEFLMLCQEEVVNIISSNQLNVPSEEKVFESILIWIRHDVHSRQQHLSTLIEHVRVRFLSKNYLLETFLKEPLLKYDEKCKDFIEEALRCCRFKEYYPKLSPISHRRPKGSEKLLLVIGGYPTRTDIQSYDIYEEYWTKLTDIPLAMSRFEACTAVLNDKVYLMGGSSGRRRCRTVVIYDPLTDQWTNSVDMQSKRQRFAVGILRNCICAVGGIGSQEARTAEKFDPKTQKWSDLAPMLIKRSDHGVGVIDDFLYAVGGHDGDGQLCSVERYNPETNIWTSVKDMNSRRSGLGVAALNGKLYAVGGWNGSEHLKTAEVFDPKSGTWTSIADMHDCRYGVGTVACNNLLYVVAGRYDNYNSLASAEIYNPETNTWTILSSSLSATREFPCVAIIGKI